MLTGRIEKLNSTYLVTAAVVDPTTGVTVTSISEEAHGDEEILPAIRRLSNRVRETLGEQLSAIEVTDRQLEKVTTPSLWALQLFSKANRVMCAACSPGGTAEGLLRQALAEDPEFASGYMFLAHAIANQHRPAEEYLPYAERALELSRTTSERERYFILGSYYRMIGEHEKAIATYETLVRLYPDHYWGTNNLGGNNLRLGRLEEAARWHARRADLRPNDFRVNVHAAKSLFRYAGDLAAAEPYLRRARELASAEAEQQFSELASWLRFFPVEEAWFRGDVEQALSELNRVTASGPPQRNGRDHWYWYAGTAYLTLGKLQAAEDMFLKKKEDFRPAQYAHVAWVRGDEQAVRERFQGVAPRAHGMVLRARAGWLRFGKNSPRGREMFPDLMARMIRSSSVNWPGSKDAPPTRFRCSSKLSADFLKGVTWTRFR